MYGPLERRTGQEEDHIDATTSRALTLLALGLALALPNDARAQDHTHRQPSWVTDIGAAGANIVAGAVTAAVAAVIRGNDVSDAFLKGAAGGGLVFLGKRLAVERFDGAGLLGRELAGVGASVVTNGGAGRDLLDEVWLPLGPAWVQVRPRSGLRARLNLREIGTLVWAATRPELRFDPARSISNGVAVFVADHHRITSASDHLAGFAEAGIVALGRTRLDMEVIQRHENIHVIQHDYLLHTMTRPLEAWGWSWITDRSIPVDLDVLTLFLYPDILSDIHEREAQVLEFR